MTRRGYDFIPIFSPKTHGMSLAYYDWKNKNITFNLGTWKYNYGIRASHALYRRFIHALSHEVIHSVIFKLLEQDKFNGSINPEWPTEHMDLYTGKNR